MMEPPAGIFIKQKNSRTLLTKIADSRPTVQAGTPMTVTEEGPSAS